MKQVARVEFFVVGGGPAGAAAAMTLAAAGREVVVVERTGYGGPRLGETLPPAANPILAELGLTGGLTSVGHLRCPGTVCCWGREGPYFNDYLFDPDGDGLHLDRAGFDALLARKAVAAGANVLVGCEVRSCGPNEGGWDVEIACSRGDCRFQVATLIDAAGRQPWPGRPSRRRAFDCQVALVGTFVVSQGDKEVDGRTWIEAVSSGWWYSAALPDNRLVVAYFTDADLLHAPAENRGTVWDELLGETRLTRDRLRHVECLSDLRVVSASSAIADPIAGAGYVAIGDAACTIDPMSSQGILHALTSGRDVARALISPKRSQAILRWAKGIVARFRGDLQTRQQFCRSERRWPASRFWRRRARPPVPVNPVSAIRGDCEGSAKVGVPGDYGTMNPTSRGDAPRFVSNVFH
jgi:flavin-dependent dehydrogenase